MSDDIDLDKMFAGAKREPLEPSADFMSRVLSDAQEMQPAPQGVMDKTPQKQGFFSEMLSGLSDAIGGWPAFAGLATAAVTGLWIGVSPPQGLIEPFGSVLGTDTSLLGETLEFGDGFDFTMFEG